MDIIFVGSVVDRKTLLTLPDASVAGNKMQLGFIKGFLDNGFSVKVFSVEANGMWHFNKKKICVGSKNLQEGNANIKTLPYINIPVLKQLCIYWGLGSRLKKNMSANDSVVIVYNTMSMFALPVLKVSQRKKCKSIAVVADLPIKFRKNFVRKIEDHLQEKLISRFDSLIPLTQNIAEDFAPGKPFCVIEAGVNPDDYSQRRANPAPFFGCEKQRNVVFSGTLNQLSGIELLIDAMSLLKGSEIVLHVYGDGPLRSIVVNASERDANIIYHGKVDNQTMVSIQQEADLLVCPRCKDGYTTKYTFPSKILEYICSGTPVLANRLEGIPLEYESYVNFCDSETPAEWAAMLTQVLDTEYQACKEKATYAKNHVMVSKSWAKQCEKINNTLF